MITRNDIIAEAITWDGTKWQHQASLKNVACDCAGFIRGVYHNVTGTEIPLVDYPATWHLFQNEPRMYNECKKYFTEIPLNEAKPGDIVIFRYRPVFVAHHMCFLLPNDRFIHADMDAGIVHVSPYNDLWRSRATNAFKFREVGDD